MIESIKTIDGKVLKADDIMPFGGDPEYFAKVGNDLYYKSENGNYTLLEKNFYKNKKS